MKILFVTLTRNDEALGVMYLSSILKQHGHEVIGVMTERENIFEVVKKFKPDLIGYSAMSCERTKILEINKKLKEENNFFSIIGGPLATFSQEIIYEDGVDAICIGEGEAALLELVTNLENKTNIKNIKNILIKINGEVYKNEIRPFIENLDSISFPDRTIFEKFKEDKRYNVIAGRGCPFNCTYCHNKSYKEIYEGKGRLVRYRSVDNIIEEMKGLKEKFNPTLFWFLEDHFFMDLNVLKEFAQKYREKVNIPFVCSYRPEVVTDKVMEALRYANCIMIFTGCEAGNDKIRKDILNRNITKKQILKVTELGRKHGIKVIFQNMVGIPKGDFDADLETLELNIKAKPYYSWASICTPYPGTKLYEIAKEEGLLSENYDNEVKETYHFKSSLNLLHTEKINILHKIFALVVEYPFLFKIVKNPDFYKDVNDDKIKELKEVFDSFKDYKYDKLHNPWLEVPQIVINFLNKYKKEYFKGMIPPAEIIDRMSIQKLNIEKTGDPYLNGEFEELKRIIETFKEENFGIEDEWIDELYQINKETWDLLQEMNNEKKKENPDYEKIGKLYLKAEILNKDRIAIKNKIVEQTGVGFKEIKKDHPSE